MQKHWISHPAKHEELARRVATIVLAGGQGRRLFPLTLTRCKPAVSFGGQYRLIDIPISSAINTHINQIFIISQYLATTIHEHVLETYTLDPFRTSKIELLSPEEKPTGKVWFKGTADAIRQNLEHFKASPVDYFLILSGDQLYNMHFFDLLEYAETSGADLVIAALPVKETEARRMGLLKVDGEATVKAFVEKPTDPKVLREYELSDIFFATHNVSKKGDHLYLGSMGIYVFKREVLFQLLDEQGDDFGKDLIPIQVAKGGKTSAYIYEGYWEDIGTVASYYEASMALTSQQECLNTYDENCPIYTHSLHLPSPLIKNAVIKNSIISDGAIVEGAEVNRSIIGIRSHIKKGTVISDSIVLGNEHYFAKAHQTPVLPENFSIGENCRIERAIIDEHVWIGNGVQLINRDKKMTFDGDGIYIRDGIIIVSSGTRLPDGFIL